MRYTDNRFNKYMCAQPQGNSSKGAVPPFLSPQYSQNPAAPLMPWHYDSIPSRELSLSGHRLQSQAAAIDRAGFARVYRSSSLLGWAAYFIAFWCSVGLQSALAAMWVLWARGVEAFLSTRGSLAGSRRILSSPSSTAPLQPNCWKYTERLWSAWPCAAMGARQES